VGTLEELDELASGGSSLPSGDRQRPPLVRLGPRDSVVVLTRRVQAGESFCGTAGETWTMAAQLDVGNKLAATPIAAGERVIKVGMPIGIATQAIAPGELVHGHNLRSDYIPTDVAEAIPIGVAEAPGGDGADD
jgi:altronate dehydratase small subunit